MAVTPTALRLLITTKGADMPREVPLIHPGMILLEDWLKPMGISQYALAKAIDVSPRRINEIVKGLRGICGSLIIVRMLLNLEHCLH